MIFYRQKARGKYVSYLFEVTVLPFHKVFLKDNMENIWRGKGESIVEEFENDNQI